MVGNLLVFKFARSFQLEHMHTALQDEDCSCMGWSCRNSGTLLHRLERSPGQSSLRERSI